MAKERLDRKNIRKWMQLPFRGDKGLQIWELVDYYRLLTGMTTEHFLLSAIGNFIEKDNEMLATAVKDYLTYLRKNPRRRGRPYGYTVTDSTRQKLTVKNKETYNARKQLEEEIKREMTNE